MKHSDFTKKFHWLNGLSEYYRFTGQEEKFEPIFKALYHNNYHRKRDIIMKFIEDEYEGVKQNAPYELRRAWINVLLNEDMPDIEVKAQLITSLISTVANDEFVDRICHFIDYFIFNNETDRTHYISNTYALNKVKRGESNHQRYVKTESPGWSQQEAAHY